VRVIVGDVMKWVAMAITPVDEALHEPIDGALWHDVVTFSLRDDGVGLTIDADIDVQLGEPRLVASIVISLDGDTLADRQRIYDDRPQADWDVMAVGGLTFRIHEMLVEWLIQVAMGDVKAYLVCRAVDDGSWIGRPGGPRGGGYSHRITASGDVMRGDQRWVINATGIRERWWGPDRPRDQVRMVPFTVADS
jgi:hypothetical protein